MEGKAVRMRKCLVLPPACLHLVPTLKTVRKGKQPAWSLREALSGRLGLLGVDEVLSEVYCWHRYSHVKTPMTQTHGNGKNLLRSKHLC